MEHAQENSIILEYLYDSYLEVFNAADVNHTYMVKQVQPHFDRSWKYCTGNINFRIQNPKIPWALVFLPCSISSAALVLCQSDPALFTSTAGRSLEGNSRTAAERAERR
jgi:hypothetical protein